MRPYRYRLTSGHNLGGWIEVLSKYSIPYEILPPPENRNKRRANRNRRQDNQILQRHDNQRGGCKWILFSVFVAGLMVTLWLMCWNVKGTDSTVKVDL